MFKQLKLRARILLAIFPLVVITQSLVIVLVFHNFRNIIEKYTLETANNTGRSYRYQIENEMNSAMAVIKTTAHHMENYTSIPAQHRRAVFLDMLKKVLQSNSSFLTTWAVWEPDSLDMSDKEYAGKQGYDSTGRFVPCWSRTSDQQFVLEPTTGYETEETGAYYILPRKARKEVVIDPYEYVLNGKKVLLTTFSVPIFHDNQVVGVVGTDFLVGSFQSIVDSIDQGGTGISAIYSNNGTIVAHFNKEKVGKIAAETEQNFIGKNLDLFIKAIKAGSAYTFSVYSPQYRSDVHMQTLPIQIGKSDTHWSFLYGVPLKKTFAPVNAARIQAVIISSVSLVLLLIVLFFISSKIVKPLRLLISTLKDISEGDGDLTRRIDVNSSDEIGEFARYFNIFVKKIHSLVGSISESTTRLTQECDSISSAVMNAATTTEETAVQAQAATSAVTDTSEKIQSISDAAQKTSGSTDSVATAVEEMSVSLNEVSKNCQQENSVVSRADELAKATTEKMQHLARAANEVGKVTQIIGEIANRTKLLALNAAIEASSAGDAGKGFTIVAEEVKSLARQVSDATATISARLEEIQNATREASKGSSDIATILEEINDITTVTMSAVEEQSATIKEVALRATSVNSDASGIAANVSTSSNNISEISLVIKGVSDSAENTARSVTKIKNSIQELTKMSTELNDIISHFKI